MRAYKHGTIWCLWRWTEVESAYITRLHLLKTPWFAVCLHWIKKPDPEPYLHDHPVTFLSILLRGAYYEDRMDGGRWMNRRWIVRCRGVTHRWLNYILATDRHAIRWVAPNTLTLCFMGPKTREWGFYTESGWVMWKDYYAKQRAQAAT